MRFGLFRTGLGWVEAVGDRVGRLISLERRSTSNRDDDYVKSQMALGRTRPGESEEMQEYGKPEVKVNNQNTGDERDEFTGPDTSSLTAFLLSLLSYGTQGGRRSEDEESYTSGEGSDFDDHELAEDDDDRASNSTTSSESPEISRPQETSGWPRTNAKVSTPGLGKRDSVGGRDSGDWLEASPSHEAGEGLSSRTATERGEDDNAVEQARDGWSDRGRGESRVHTKKRKSKAEPQTPSSSHVNKVDGASCSPTGRAEVQSPGSTLSPGRVKSPRNPTKLPDMAEESFLLTDGLRTLICTALPAIATGREWVLLYSTIKHGISLLTLYRRSALLSGPCLLVVGDREGAVFGGLSSGPLISSNRKKYQGTSDSFVFSDCHGSEQLYRASGINRYFVLCMSEALAFGGGGHFALRLDGELLSGTSGPCETYANPCLASSEEFSIKNVELWGFAHASRYAPAKSAWHEPEAALGISNNAW